MNEPEYRKKDAESESRSVVATVIYTVLGIGFACVAIYFAFVALTSDGANWLIWVYAAIALLTSVGSVLCAMTGSAKGLFDNLVDFLWIWR